MKKLSFLFLLICISAKAEGPIYKQKETIPQLEFDNVYQDIRSLRSSASVQSIEFIIAGGGSAITTGSKGYLIVEYGGTINRWTAIADQSGSIAVDIKRASYANFPTTTSIIGSGNAPTLSTAQKNQSTPSGWTSTTINSGDILEYSVTSATTVTQVTVSLKVSKT